MRSCNKTMVKMLLRGNIDISILPLEFEVKISQNNPKTRKS